MRKGKRGRGRTQTSREIDRGEERRGEEIQMTTDLEDGGWMDSHVGRQVGTKTAQIIMRIAE